MENVPRLPYLIVGSADWRLQNMHEAEVLEITDDFMPVLAES